MRGTFYTHGARPVAHVASGTAVLAAIFGMIGVVIGGALNAVTSRLAARHQERLEVRTAVRLLVDKLESGHRPLRRCFQYKRYEIPRWDEHELALARVLPNDTWETLTLVYTSVKLFMRRDDFDRTFWDDDDRKAWKDLGFVVLRKGFEQALHPVA